MYKKFLDITKNLNFYKTLVIIHFLKKFIANISSEFISLK